MSQNNDKLTTELRKEVERHEEIQRLKELRAALESLEYLYKNAGLDYEETSFKIAMPLLPTPVDIDISEIIEGEVSKINCFIGELS